MVWGAFLLLLLLCNSFTTGLTVSRNMQEWWLFRFVLCATMNAHLYEWIELFLKLYSHDELAASLAVLFAIMAVIS
jgi:hypothetical protein